MSHVHETFPSLPQCTFCLAFSAIFCYTLVFCGNSMTSDDNGKMLCQGCRLSPTVEATMTGEIQGIISGLKDLDKTDLFRGEEHKTYCVCCCIFTQDTNAEMFLCSSKEKCKSPNRICDKCVVINKNGNMCHMCAGVRCPTRFDLHKNDGVDDLILKFYVFETASKSVRYLANSHPCVVDHSTVI